MKFLFILGVFFTNPPPGMGIYQLGTYLTDAECQLVARNVKAYFQDSVDTECVFIRIEE